MSSTVKARQMKFPLKMLFFRNVFLRDLRRSFPLSLDLFTAILFLLLSSIFCVLSNAPTILAALKYQSNLQSGWPLIFFYLVF